MTKDTKNFTCMLRPDRGRSLQWSAEDGDVEAQFQLGKLHFEGREAESSTTQHENHVMSSFTPALPQNLVQAVEWLRKAADQGQAEARSLLEVVRGRVKGVH